MGPFRSSRETHQPRRTGRKDSMTHDVLIRVEGVSKRFARNYRASMRYGVKDLLSEVVPGRAGHNDLRADEFWAVKDVTFDLKRGESLALIGPNGSGKSTLLRMLMGRPKVTRGRIEIYSQLAAVTELGAGFNPKLSGLENIYNSCAVHGMSRSRVHEIVDEIVEFSNLDEFLEMPVENYSTGMRSRLGFAIAIHFQPEVLLIDEALAVGDLGFRRKCIRKLLQFREQGGTLIAVSHDMYTLQQLCSHSLLMHEGKILFHGSIVDGIHHGINLFQTIERARNSTETGRHSKDSVPLREQETTIEGQHPADLETGTNWSGLTEANPLCIDSVSLRPLEGKELQSNQPARVEISYRSLIDMDDRFVWGFTLLTADQLINIGSAINLEETPAYRIVRGSGRLSCVIPRLPLCAGQYGLSAAIMDADTLRSIARIGYKEPPTVFEVTAEASERSNIRALRGDLILLDVDWTGD